MVRIRYQRRIVRLPSDGKFAGTGWYTVELEVCAIGGCDTDTVRIGYFPFEWFGRRVDRAGSDLLWVRSGPVNGAFEVGPGGSSRWRIGAVHRPESATMDRWSFVA